MKRYGLVLCMVCAGVLTASCERDVPKGAAPRESVTTPRTLDTSPSLNAAAIKDKQDKYIGEMRKALDDFTLKMDALTKQVESSDGEAKASLEKKLEIAKQKRDTAIAKLDELSRATADRWEKLKDAVQNAFDDLQKAFD